MVAIGIIVTVKRQFVLNVPIKIFLYIPATERTASFEEFRSASGISSCDTQVSDIAKAIMFGLAFEYINYRLHCIRLVWLYFMLDLHRDSPESQCWRLSHMQGSPKKHSEALDSG